MDVAEKIASGGVALLAALASFLLLMEPPARPGERPHLRQVETVHRKGGTAPVTAQLVSAPATQLIVPVAGVASSQLADTWGQARAEGRTHQGIDIMAPLGANVVSAVEGRVVKFFTSVRGGTTIYVFDNAERFVYYYAHLSARAAGLREGDVVRQGQVIGYVGQTGNAPVPHLHFEIERLGPERYWWRAEALNPYPYLLSGEAPR